MKLDWLNLIKSNFKRLDIHFEVDCAQVVTCSCMLGTGQTRNYPWWPTWGTCGKRWGTGGAQVPSRPPGKGQIFPSVCTLCFSFLEYSLGPLGHALCQQLFLFFPFYFLFLTIPFFEYCSSIFEFSSRTPQFSTSSFWLEIARKFRCISLQREEHFFTNFNPHFNTKTCKSKKSISFFLQVQEQKWWVFFKHL